MPRIDIAKLRKNRGMSQSELAQLLNITQSFMSAIENGRSPLPPEKEARIMQIFNLTDLSDYTTDNTPPAEPQSKSIDDMDESYLFNQLLNRFHNHAHKHETLGQCDRIAALEDRIEKLLARNDKLFERNDALVETIDALNSEIASLRKEVYTLRTKLLELKAES